MAYSNQHFPIPGQSLYSMIEKFPFCGAAKRRPKFSGTGDGRGSAKEGVQLKFAPASVRETRSRVLLIEL